MHQRRRRNRLSHDVFARLCPHFSPEVRRPALRRLAAQTRFGVEGGTQSMMYTQYLRDIAGSRVCIDPPRRRPIHIPAGRVPGRGRASSLIRIHEGRPVRPSGVVRLLLAQPTRTATTGSECLVVLRSVSTSESARCLSSSLDTGQGVAGRRRVSAQPSERGRRTKRT